MKATPLQGALADLLSSTVKVEDACTLPAWCYTSDDFFNFEQEAIFARQWFAVTHEQMLPEAGDYITVEIAGEPLIVVRADSGAVNVLSAVCRHRSCILLTDSGNCGSAMICPYHKWVYDLTGQLRGAPYMTRTRGFDKSTVSLTRLAVRTWQGFVFASFSPAPGQFGVPTAELSEFLKNYDLEHLALARPRTMTIQWNWKVMLENAVECYHCTALHGKLHEAAPTRNSTASPLSDMAGGFASRVRNPWPDADFTPTGSVVFPPLPGLNGQQRNHSTWLIVPPNLFLSLQHDNVHYFLVRPAAADSTVMEVGYLYPPSAIDLPDFGERFELAMSSWLPIIDQDNEINRRVQRGLRSRFAARGRYSWLESALVGFNRWLVQCYQSATAENSRQEAAVWPGQDDHAHGKDGPS